MLYLIKQALKTAEQKEQEETSIATCNLTFNDEKLKLGNLRQFDNQGNFKVETNIDNTLVYEGDKFSNSISVISSILSNYWEDLDDFTAQRVTDDYNSTLEDVGMFKEYLYDCNVLLSNDTFESDFNLYELIQEYFEAYI